MATSKQQQLLQLSVSRIDSRAFSFIAPGAIAAHKVNLFLRLRSARGFITSLSLSDINVCSRHVTVCVCVSVRVSVRVSVEYRAVC